MNPTRKDFAPGDYFFPPLPVDLDERAEFNLVQMLAAYAAEWTQRAHIELDFHQIGLHLERMPAGVGAAIYSIAQEALENVLQHSEAGYVSVILEQRPDSIQLIIEDDGGGFDVNGVRQKNETGGSGLIESEARAAALKGTFRIDSVIGKGSTVFVKIPLDEKMSDAAKN